MSVGFLLAGLTLVVSYKENSVENQVAQPNAWEGRRVAAVVLSPRVVQLR